MTERPHPTPEPAGALRGLVVLDLSRVRAGPACTRHFADFGAEVIKVESPPGQAGGDMFDDRDNADFQNLHRNKRSITLNLKHPRGRELFLALADAADVVVENFRPDVKFRLGIDYETLAARNARIILASVSGFGEDGPYRERPGFDQVAQGMGGLMSVTGPPGEPMRAGAAVADLAAGMNATIGILTALAERSRSGRGQWVQANLLHSQVALLDFVAARYLRDGRVPGSVGNDHPTLAPSSAYPTADGRVNVSALSAEIWQRFARALGHEEWIGRPEYADAAARVRHREALNAEIAAATRNLSSDALIARLNDAGVPCGPIHALDAVFEDPQVRHLGVVVPLEHPRLGPQRLLGSPVGLSRTPARVGSVAPDIGADTADVLARVGIDADALARLRADGVV